ncbi:sialin-like [Mya arenaria]|uniref:sialin-like n=1 Tax=Mya arenaria TaxID=6604 RepID=UPI0022E2B778|nr:sialin-like [Mya arenaria]
MDTSQRRASIWCSSRLALTIVAFFGFINLYALRVDMSFAIVCMTRTPVDCNQTTSENQTILVEYARCQQDEGDRFDWDKKTQGLILGSFFWGYIATQLPGGWLAGRFGGKHLFGLSMLVCALVTLIMPFAARTSVIFLLVLRVIAGLGQGVVWPCMQTLFSNWAPPLERSKLSGFVYAGCQIGIMVTFPLSGMLCEEGFDGGWPSIFYILGGVGVLWFVAWTVIVSGSPADHPRISDHEREYITNSLRQDIDVTKKSTHTPWVKICTSLPVWAIIVTHACANWGTYTFMTNIPTYMQDVLKFNIKKTGFLSALPYIGFWAMTNVSGQAADCMRARGVMTTTTARKLFNSLGTLLPAVFVILTGHMGERPEVAVAMLTLGVAMSGCQYGSGFIVNPVDIAPRYAGIIFGISNTTGTLGGFLAPMAIGYLTSDRTREQWQMVFYIAAAIYTVGAIFYIIFGSGEVQPWALDPGTEVELPVYREPVEKKNDDKTREPVQGDSNLPGSSAIRLTQSDMSTEICSFCSLCKVTFFMGDMGDIGLIVGATLCCSAAATKSNFGGRIELSFFAVSFFAVSFFAVSFFAEVGFAKVGFAEVSFADEVGSAEVGFADEVGFAGA